MSQSGASAMLLCGKRAAFLLLIAAAVTIPVAAQGKLKITTQTLPNGEVGASYSASVQANGGRTPYSWSVNSGSLPEGLTLGANTGAIAGIPKTAGTFAFAVRVTDAARDTDTVNLSIVISPAISISTTSLPNAILSAEYSQTLTAVNGTGGNTWSVVSGSLPPGLALSEAGVISGVPSSIGSSSFTVQVKDASGGIATKQLSIAVLAPPILITTASLTGGTIGTPYSATLAAAGGIGEYSWSVASGSLPAGLSLSASGTISGTPSSAGTSTFTVSVRDSAGATATKQLSIVVSPPALVISTDSLPGGTVGSSYSQTLTATGGTGGYSWSVASGSLPAGLSLSATGTISGTPSSSGTSTFTVRVRDSSGATATKDLSIAVNPPALVISTTSLPGGSVGSPYSATLTATGGSGGNSWSISSGSLPAGLSLSGSGTISGSPTASGTAAFTVRVRDNSGATATKDLTINIAPPGLTVATTSLPGATVGAAYSQSLVANGGSGDYSWSIISGALPPGLSLGASGAITGTPTSAGSSTFTAQVRDSNLAVATAVLSIQVGAGVTITTAPVLTAAVVGERYALTFVAAGGNPPYTWSVTAGALPPGISLNGRGELSGTPTGAGTFTFTAQAVDSRNAGATKEFTLTVAGSLTITTQNTLPSGRLATAYELELTATGGAPPYRWQVSSGNLPSGLSLEGSSGIITGTPSSAGSFQFTVTAADSTGLSTQKAFTLDIAQGLSFTTPAALPNATAGVAYTFTLGASGGQPPYSWSITEGALPPGLSLNGVSGAITGTPASQGTYNFTLRVTDAANQSASRIHTIIVDLPSTGPSVAINGIPSRIAPLQQPAIDIALSNPFPVTMTGEIRVSFAPGGPNPADDPSIQFSTGGRSASFTIPANSTHAVFSSPQFAIQVGSVAGTLSFSINSLMAGSTPYVPPGGSTFTAQIDAAAPAIRTVNVTRSQGGFQVRVVAVSSTRDLAQASVRLQSGGANPQTGVFAIPLESAAKTWFQSQTSALYGGQFTLTLPFTFTGPEVSLSTVSVTLSNSAGNSLEASAPY